MHYKKAKIKIASKEDISLIIYRLQVGCSDDFKY